MYLSFALIARTLDSNCNSLHDRQESKSVLLGVGSFIVTVTDGSTFHGFSALSFHLEEYLGLETNEPRFSDIRVAAIPILLWL